MNTEGDIAVQNLAHDSRKTQTPYPVPFIHDYPEDCPRLRVRWFYAVDIAKRKPLSLVKGKESTKPPAQPKKFATFTEHDSRSIEAAYRKTASAITDGKHGSLSHSDRVPGQPSRQATLTHNTSIDEPRAPAKENSTRVPVNEDYLFDVDIETRELAPAYWLGPVYEVRRGIWFYQEGTTQRPCDENLATQLEEGYLRLKPWRDERPPRPRSASGVAEEATPSSTSISRSSSVRQTSKEVEATASATSSDQAPFKSYKLFGSYMGSVVTYQDSATAWLLSGDLLSRLSGIAYSRFAGGSHLGGVKLTRGYVPQTKAGKNEVQTTENPTLVVADAKFESSKPPTDESNALKSPIARSSLDVVDHSLTNIPAKDSSKSNQEREEREIRDDYRTEPGDQQDREIDHLILVTHGIGQKLGQRLSESLNFIHDVNMLRKTLKSIYESSPDLQNLNAEVDKLPKNCRVQVLPVVWRHLIDFPRQPMLRRRREQDLSDVALGEDLAYPTLADVTIEGVPAVRSLVEDLILDVLLYQSMYRDHIGDIVRDEANRVYDLFLERNPTFKGKVSLVGHSLGSAIFFDLLCREKSSSVAAPKQFHSRRKPSVNLNKAQAKFHFDVEDLYCLGSPIGLFEMLKGKTIVGRTSAPSLATSSSLSAESAFGLPHDHSTELDDENVSSPRCKQLFNIFHPTDPVAYRMEPLISSAMKSMKPQPLPYIKKSIFRGPAAGLTNIGARVGQSVSDLWSNLASGVASSMLSRSLGLSNESTQTNVQSRAPLSLTSLQSPTDSGPGSQAETSEENKHAKTLIDSELETLYSGFQREQNAQSRNQQSDGRQLKVKDNDNAASRIRREEAKVRALNGNGRVDYSIQEGVFDISLIASLASHLSYWGDEDVNHFVLSQLLSKPRDSAAKK